MPSKEQTIESLKVKSYSYAEVKHLISHITCIEEGKDEIELMKQEIVKFKEDLLAERRPTHLKTGDCYIQPCGTKRRPCVVVKVLEDVVLAIPLSTTEDSLNLYPSNSRFLKSGWFSNQLITTKKEEALREYCGVYDNEKRVRKVIKVMKEFVNNSL